MPRKDSIPRAYYVLKRKKKGLPALFMVCFISLVACEHLAAEFWGKKIEKSTAKKVVFF